MKSVALTIINLYQRIISPLLHQLLGVRTICRYPQTCSEYTKRAIEQYGILRGSKMALKRFLSCQPFSKMTYGSL